MPSRTVGARTVQSWAFSFALHAALLATVGCAQDEREQRPSAQPDADGVAHSTGEASRAVAELAEADMGSADPAHGVGNLFLTGLPAPDDLRLWKQSGVETVVSLLSPGEVDWDEEAAVREAGMEFVQIPFGDDDSVFDQTRQVLRASQGSPLVLHCMSSNRVGSAWLAYRVLDEGVELERALNEAKQAGLLSRKLEERALRYIERAQTPATSEP